MASNLYFYAIFVSSKYHKILNFTSKDANNDLSNHPLTRFYSKNREIHPETSFGGPSCKCKSFLSLSLSLSYLLPLLATLKTEIDRVCRLAIHTQRRFFSLAQKVHHLTQLPAIPLQTQVFFFSYENFRHQTKSRDGSFWYYSH